MEKYTKGTKPCRNPYSNQHDMLCHAPHHAQSRGHTFSTNHRPCQGKLIVIFTYNFTYKPAWPTPIG